MIKECRIILHNSEVTVVDFEGVQIQFPSINTDSKTVYVEYIDDRYFIVSKEYYEKSLTSKFKKKTKQNKTTEIELIDEVVKSEAVENETDEISE